MALSRHIHIGYCTDMEIRPDTVQYVLCPYWMFFYLKKIYTLPPLASHDLPFPLSSHEFSQAAPHSSTGNVGRGARLRPAARHLLSAAAAGAPLPSLRHRVFFPLIRSPEYRFPLFSLLCSARIVDWFFSFRFSLLCSGQPGQAELQLLE